MTDIIPLILAYGESGTNKSGLIDTAKNALVVSSSPSIVRLRDKEDIRIRHVDSIDSLEAAIDGLNDEVALQYDWHCFDSLSQIAESCLLESDSVDRKTYMRAQNRLMRCLLKLTANRTRPTYCTAWQKELVYNDGQQRSSPSFPGVALTGKIPHLFTNIMHMHCIDTDDGEPTVAARNRKTAEYYAKDESGKLPEIIKNPNLTQILQTMRS